MLSEAKWAIFGVFGLSGLFLNGLVQFDHPYIFNIHGSVLFCRDCWEEDGVCRGWDFGEGGAGTFNLKKVRNPLFCCVQWGPMLAREQMEASYSIFRERNGGFQVYFGVFTVR